MHISTVATPETPEKPVIPVGIATVFYARTLEFFSFNSPEAYCTVRTRIA